MRIVSLGLSVSSKETKLLGERRRWSGQCALLVEGWWLAFVVDCVEDQDGGDGVKRLGGELDVEGGASVG
jgi:hypothetical protein